MSCHIRGCRRIPAGDSAEVLHYQPAGAGKPCGGVEQGWGCEGGTITLNHQVSLEAIIKELDLPKSTDFSGNPGGFNLLNTPDNLYAELGPDGFWIAYNKPFLDAAISRGDEFIIATPIINNNLYLSDSQGLTGFGREYFYLLEQGYEYMDGRMVIK